MMSNKYSFFLFSYQNVAPTFYFNKRGLNLLCELGYWFQALVYLQFYMKGEKCANVLNVTAKLTVGKRFLRFSTVVAVFPTNVFP